MTPMIIEVGEGPSRAIPYRTTSHAIARLPPHVGGQDHKEEHENVKKDGDAEGREGVKGTGG
eukprot:9490688-Pyramimonas_sp.AAC.1